jgi:hypothetical protein
LRDVPSFVSAVKANPTFDIEFRRLRRVDQSPGLVALSIKATDGSEAPATRIGVLTDVALRGRLAHWNLHSANEVAVIRRTLDAEQGRVTVQEGWPGMSSCLRFWHDFGGSQIRVVEWTCQACAANNRVAVGALAGEAFSRKCRCGKVSRVSRTIPVPPAP